MVSKKKLFVICLLLLGVIDIYFLGIQVQTKYQNYNDSKPAYVNKKLQGYINFSNMDDLFEVITDRYNCLTVISALRNDTRYLNFILQDVPKAKTIEIYYLANEEAIKNIYGFTSSEEFEEFYNMIKPLQDITSYEVVTDSVNIISDKCIVEVKIKGTEDIIVPITINIKDSKNLKSSSFWNRR